MKLLIVNESSTAVPRQFIGNWMQLLGTELRRKRIITARQLELELTLVFLNSQAAQKINFEFRGKRYPTDVLSFAAMEDDSFGELVLCPEVLKRQAKEHGLSYRHELGYMLLHGVLHLLGYDHEAGPRQAEEMFSLQDDVFEKLLKKLKNPATG